MARLRAAQAALDLDAEAEANADLGREGFRAARACVRAWRVLADPETGLFPRGGGGANALIWNGQDTAADLFPHMLYASIRVAPDEEPVWREVLAAERRFARQRASAHDPPAADARSSSSPRKSSCRTAPSTRRTGWYRWWSGWAKVPGSIGCAKSLARWSLAPRSRPRQGAIPSTSAEVNGNLCRSVARLYPLTRDRGQLEMVERIAAWYCADVLPRNGYLPPRAWDLAKDAPRDAFVKLRDHGGEVVPGLAEIYLLSASKEAPLADRLRAPFHAMLGSVIDAERMLDGLWLDRVDPTTGKLREGRTRRVVDTWGYLANAFVMADLAENERWRPISGAAAATPSRSSGSCAPHRDFTACAGSTGAPYDGYADAIESMLCLLPFHPVDGAAEWIDDEIAVFFAMQRRDGFIARYYLDGNFVRTAMLYAEWKTRGARLEPWREDLRIGAAGRGAPDHRLRLYLAADDPWSGRLCLDRVRHRTSWNLRLDYPRRNASPEWFTVESGRSYVVRDLDTGETAMHDGAELAAGLPFTLEPGRPRRLSIEPS